MNKKDNQYIITLLVEDKGDSASVTIMGKRNLQCLIEGARALIRNASDHFDISKEALLIALAMEE